MAPRPSSPTTLGIDPTIPERIAALEAELAALRAQQDELLIAAIERVMGHVHDFSVAEVWARATGENENPELLARLHESRIASPRQLGKQLHRLTGRVFGPFVVERLGVDYRGAIWILRVIPHSQVPPCASPPVRA